MSVESHVIFRIETKRQCDEALEVVAQYPMLEVHND